MVKHQQRINIFYHIPIHNYFIVKMNKPWNVAKGYTFQSTNLIHIAYTLKH